MNQGKNKRCIGKNGPQHLIPRELGLGILDMRTMTWNLTREITEVSART